jgi:glutamate synthase (NADPH/NADH) small chain
LNEAPVLIRNIESAIVDRGFSEGWVKPAVKPETVNHSGFNVAVVGSGPAGLAAAQQLVRRGHRVTVFEKKSLLGGLLRYGIPDFKMEKDVLDRRLRQLKDEGVKFVTDAEIGKDFQPEDLERNFHSVCLTVGSETPRDLVLPGRDAQGIHYAMDFLVAQNKSIAENKKSLLSAEEKNVIILGGGDTGSDCLGTALRQGCASITQFEILGKPPLWRDERTPWPFWPVQLRTSHAHEEGGKREWGLATTEFLTENGKLTGLRTVRTEVVDGRILPIQGTEKTWKADLVFLALGFTGPAQLNWMDKLGVRRDFLGNIQVNSRFETSVSGFFSAGDAKRGASLIVWAIAEGRKMAASVDRYLLRRESHHVSFGRIES